MHTILEDDLLNFRSDPPNIANKNSIYTDDIFTNTQLLCAMYLENYPS